MQSAHAGLGMLTPGLLAQLVQPAGPGVEENQRHLEATVRGVLGAAHRAIDAGGPGALTPQQAALVARVLTETARGVAFSDSVSVFGLGSLTAVSLGRASHLSLLGEAFAPVLRPPAFARLASRATAPAFCRSPRGLCGCFGSPCGLVARTWAVREPTFIQQPRTQSARWLKWWQATTLSTPRPFLMTWCLLPATPARPQQLWPSRMQHQPGWTLASARAAAAAAAAGARAADSAPHRPSRWSSSRLVRRMPGRCGPVSRRTSMLPPPRRTPAPALRPPPRPGGRPDRQRTLHQWRQPPALK